MKIHKLNILGQIIETIELNDHFVRPGKNYLIECEDKNYFLTEKYIDTIEPNLKKIQKHFINLVK
jgi:hypothetical protein